METRPDTRTSADAAPRLRPVDFYPVQVKSERMICLRDPQQIAAESVLLSYPAFFIVSRLNGSNSLRDIQADFFRQFGEMIYIDKIEQLVQMLDEKFFLESRTFEEYRLRQVEEFRGSTVRPAMHAGTAYEADSEKLRQQIAGFFFHPEGLGSECTLAGAETIRGVVAPHIDFQRGGPTYSWAYGSLRTDPPQDLYIIFGTCHSYLSQPFCLTLKDFTTPLGTALTDKEIAAQLQEGSSFDLLEGEWTHRSEHSIEFQVVFLQYLFPQSTFKILPVLCGNLFDETTTGRPSQVAAKATEFLSRLSDRIAKSGKRACYVAGADLAHMGPRFGDREPVSGGLLAWLRSADLKLLKLAENVDNAGFLGNILDDGDKRRICGTSPIYALLSVCGASQGKLLRYDQAADPDGTQVVSFASMAFY